MITGCSSGIGRALTEAFVAAGNRVAATARRRESIADLEGDRCLVSTVDVTDTASIEHAVEKTIAWAGRIDILVNNAGYGLIGPVAELDDGDLRRQLDTNVVGAVAAVRAVFPHMAAQRSGCIVNIGSVSSVLATPFGGAYSASKAAVHLLSDALRAEVRPFGISVVAVRAGAVATRFAQVAGQSVDRYRQPSSRYHEYLDGIERRARLSTNMAEPAADVADRVVRAVSGPNPPAVIKIGGGARLVPAMAVLPKKLLAWMLGRKFGLR
jgi:NAD(P)-dependent dehydrogenase (short-subunit alcohol dehydrogenase family)